MATMTIALARDAAPNPLRSEPVNTVFHDDCDVAVVGAGPYGLSLGAHLSAAMIETRVFGDPMSYWRDHMPAGMKLRSPWEATHIADPDDLLSLDDYSEVSGLGRPDPLPIEDFIRYGDWFQKNALPDLDRRKVVGVARASRGFWLKFDDGSALHAGRVVLATGLAQQDYRPLAFVDLPEELVSHTSDHADLARFRGRSVAVIGRGQSACESAALLQEAGCEVEMICRGGIHWLGAQTSGNAHRRDAYWQLHKMLTTKSGVGPFPLNWINEEPDLVQRMPIGLRQWISAHSLRAGAAGWVKPRLAGVRIDAGRTIRGAHARGEKIVLNMGTGRREFDHALLAPGYRIDVARQTMLAPELRDAIVTRDGSPVLAEGYESSVRGLHFVGASAVASYGPLLRFVWGAGYAARTVTRFMMGNRSDFVRGRAKPMPAPEMLVHRIETASQLN